MPEVEFGVDEKSSQALCDDLVSFCNRRGRELMPFLKTAITACLRMSRVATVDVSRLIRFGLKPFCTISLEDASPDYDAAAVHNICVAYEAGSMELAEWQRIPDLIKVIPAKPQPGGRTLRDLFVLFPEHGSVILEGAKTNTKVIKTFEKPRQNFERMISQISNLADESADVNLSKVEDGILSIVDWYKDVDPAYFETFLYEPEKEERFLSQFHDLMLALSGTHFNLRGPTGPPRPLPRTPGLWPQPDLDTPRPAGLA